MINPASVPFYGNTPDGTHCFQASIKMILGCFLPQREFTWEELEQLSAKKEGLSTWPQQTLINLRRMGFEVIMVEGFDGKAFIKEGGKYLCDAFGKEVADWQIAHSDIPQEQRLYQEAYDSGVDIQKRTPNLAEVRAYLERDYMIKTSVNSRKLQGREGYVGHSVVILAVSDDEVLLHDPGLPPRAAAKVPLKQFMAAWADPDETAQNFIAIKPENR